jgi:hypothetical protein
MPVMYAPAAVLAVLATKPRLQPGEGMLYRLIRLRAANRLLADSLSAC